jgi:redox-sensitive bicupin YhaK (pirin superfamily)
MHHDPFVLWDDFRIQPGAGFPTHPHRGFEAITYLFAGAISHADNLGNHSTITAGGAQRFTAGRGIEHSEMPGEQGISHGIQLWINLPQHLKGIAPDYQEVQGAEIPEETFAGGRARTIVGDGSPLRLHTPVDYREVNLDRGVDYGGTMPGTHRGFIYVVEGELALESSTLTAGNACFPEPGRPWTLQAVSPARLMICSGIPHREPIRQHGSFVD